MTQVIVDQIKENEMLRGIVDRTIREAVFLQRHANADYARQTALRENGKTYSFMRKNSLEEGVAACCNVLQKVFGDIPMRSINAIQKIAAENQSVYVGSDAQNYISLFATAFESY